MLNKTFSLIYVFLLIVLTIVLCLRISNITIDSSILSLLPTETQSKVSKNTIDTYTKRLDRQVVFLIKDNGDGVKACDFFYKELKKTRVLKTSSVLLIKERNRTSINFYTTIKQL